MVNLGIGFSCELCYTTADDSSWNTLGSPYLLPCCALHDDPDDLPALLRGERQAQQPFEGVHVVGSTHHHAEDTAADLLKDTAVTWVAVTVMKDTVMAVTFNEWKLHNE